MKRLIKKAEILDLYHGTSSNFLVSIMQSGLQPSDKTNNTAWEGSLSTQNSDSIYLASNPTYAHEMAYATIDKYGGSIMVINVGVNPDIGELVGDEDYYKNDETGSTDWRESLKNHQSVAYRGNIPKENFNQVTIFFEEIEQHYFVDMYLSTSQYQKIQDFFKQPNPDEQLPEGLTPCY